MPRECTSQSVPLSAITLLLILLCNASAGITVIFMGIRDEMLLPAAFLANAGAVAFALALRVAELMCARTAPVYVQPEPDDLESERAPF